LIRAISTAPTSGSRKERDQRLRPERSRRPRSTGSARRQSPQAVTLAAAQA
jgi:hypothetical protein